MCSKIISFYGHAVGQMPLTGLILESVRFFRILYSHHGEALALATLPSGELDNFDSPST